MRSRRGIGLDLRVTRTVRSAHTTPGWPEEQRLPGPQKMKAANGGDASAGGATPRRPLAAVRRVTDERAYLYQIIQTIGSGPDLETILRGIVRLVTEATSCHACFVYFATDDSLTLRAATATYAHLEGKVTIPFGEGLTGWVAKTRRSAFIHENALEDPRVRRDPGQGRRRRRRHLPPGRILRGLLRARAHDEGSELRS